MPRICLYPPCASTLRSVWAVRQTMSCSSSVIEVWMRTEPPSQGSGMPADPGRKRPAESSSKTLLKSVEI